MKKRWILAALAACAIALAGCKIVSEPEPIAVQSVTLSETTITLEYAETRILTATVYPYNADDRTVTWSSSNTDAVGVNCFNGTITANNVGTSIITARAGGCMATCLVTVNNAAVVKPNPITVESVTLNAETFTIEPGKTRTLVASVKPSNADDKTVTWTSSNSEVATVSDDGTVTAVANGTATITAKAGGKTAECIVTVRQIQIAVEHVTLDTTTLTLTRGEKGKLSATVMPDNADDTSVAWSSSNDEVATVDKDGTVTAVANGTATITAQAGEITAECTVTVNPILVKDVTLDKTTLTLTCGETEKLATTVTPSNADDTSVVWSSSNTAIATVSEDGTVTAMSKGTATITAQAGGKTATCAVTVKQAVENIALDITTVTLEPGMQKKLTATVKPDNADDKTVKWSSSNAEIATVGNDGTVTAVKAGTINITAQAGGKQATCLVTVRTDHSYSGGKCTVCGVKPYLEGGTIDENGVLTEYIGSAVHLKIPDGVTGIGNDVFKDCTSLMVVTISDSVTSIGDNAFSGLAELSFVEIGNGVTSIGNGAFYKCTSLTKVTIPGSVTNIGNYAFSGCKSLTNVTIPGSVTNIGNYAFSESGLKSIAMPNSVTSIGNDAFYKCTSLTSATISNNVTKIEKETFRMCTSLESVEIPNSVTSIGDRAFSGCKKLTNVTIGNSVTSIGDSVFFECSGLTNVTIPDSVMNIGVNMFWRCENLTSVMIGNSVTSIGNGAFYECTKLASVNIPSSVKNIGNGAFCECTSLESVTISYGVTSIEETAFFGCTSLTSVTIPGSVTSIGDSDYPETRGVFEECKNLNEVTIYEGVTHIGKRMFATCTSLASVNYTGTESQWNAITKGEDWDSGTGSYTITYNYKE